MDLVMRSEFARIRDYVTTSSAERERGKSLLYGIAGTVLLLERFFRHELQDNVSLEPLLEKIYHFELRKRTGPADLQHFIALLACGRNRTSKIGDIDSRDVADLRFTGAVNPSFTVERIESEVGREPHFHEQRRSQHDHLHRAGEHALFALPLGAGQRARNLDVAGERG